MWFQSLLVYFLIKIFYNSVTTVGRKVERTKKRFQKALDEIWKQINPPPKSKANKKTNKIKTIKTKPTEGLQLKYLSSFFAHFY